MTKQLDFAALVAASFLFVLAVSDASADPVTFNLSQGADHGFGFSFAHSGNGTSTDFAMSGFATRIGGSFTGDWNPALSLLTGITGQFTALSLSNNMNTFLGLLNGEIITVDIVGGSLRADLGTNGLPGGGGSGAPLAGGYLEYIISGNVTGVVDTGQYNFFTRAFVLAANPYPNSLTVNNAPGDDFALWGNNFVNANFPGTWANIAVALGEPANFFASQPDGTVAGSPADFTRLGIDLRGPSIPEPAALLLLGLGVAGVAARRRRTRLIALDSPPG